MLEVTPSNVVDGAVVIMVPVMIARAVIGWTHPERTHLIWTFGLPTLGVLVFFLRVTLTRKLEYFDMNDPVTAASYLVILLTQVVATIYQWMPESLVAWLEHR